MTTPPAWLTRLAAHLRSRAPLALAAGVAALATRMTLPAPPEKSVEGVAAMLGNAASGQVSPDGFLWEERGGFLADSLLGRRVLFVASKPSSQGAPAAPADLYRARVRLTRAGRPVSIHGVRNITGTPLGDERDLVGRGRYVAFATWAYGAPQGVTLLDLAGDERNRDARTRIERAQAAVESWLETGTLRGLGRVELSFGSPPADVKLDMAEDALVMAVGKEALPAALDPISGSIRMADEDPYSARAQRIPHPVRPLAPVLFELAKRGLGGGAADALQKVVAAAARERRLPRDAQKGRSGDPSVADRPLAPAEPTPSINGWPPEPIAPPISPPLPGEGVWVPARSPLLPAPAAGAESPLFFETIVRPDPGQPRGSVRLLVMDMRQLEIRMEGGFDEPRPVTGPRGSGRLPEGALAARGVAAFAGGKPHGSGEVGMVVDRRVLVPPSPGAPTIASLRDGRAAFGPWPFGSELPGDFLSIRQSPLALIEKGAPVKSSGPERVERAALGRTRDGHLVYAWSAEISADALARALELARCEAAMHLGTSPSGFAFVRSGAQTTDPRSYQAELLTPAMSVRERQIAGASPVEIFYLLLRDPRPTVPLPEGAAWSPDAGRQPPPSFLPAVFTATTSKLGAEVRLFHVAPDRFAWRVRAGSRERSHRKGGSFLGSLEATEQERASLAIGLGAAKRKGGPTRGLAIAGSVGLPIRKGDGLLLTTERGLEIRRSDEVPEIIAGDAVELPLSADEGKLLPAGRKVGSLRARAQACVLPDRTVLIALTTFDSEEAGTEVLLNAGCSRVVALDRGSQHAAFVHRAGTEAAPQPRYEPSALYAVDIPMLGRAVEIAR
jgi:hypothetical protein